MQELRSWSGTEKQTSATEERARITGADDHRWQWPSDI